MTCSLWVVVLGVMVALLSSRSWSIFGCVASLSYVDFLHGRGLSRRLELFSKTVGASGRVHPGTCGSLP